MSRARPPWVRCFSATVFAGALAVLYNAMLGFGVNERCTSNHGCSSAGCAPCARLGTYGWLHAALQVAVALGATVLVARADRREVERGRQSSTRVVILIGWCALAIALAYAHTELSWAWADR